MKRALVLGVVLAVALGLLGAGTSRAAIVPPPEGWGAAYERAAIEYWGGPTTRCWPTATVEFDSPRPELRHLVLATDRPVLGHATVAQTPGIPCHMYIAPLDGHGIYFRCILFGHEYGHWLGYADDPTDPRWSVKAELLGPYTHDRPCRELVRQVHT